MDLNGLERIGYWRAIDLRCIKSMNGLILDNFLFFRVGEIRVGIKGVRV